MLYVIRSLTNVYIERVHIRVYIEKKGKPLKNNVGPTLGKPLREDVVARRASMGDDKRIKKTRLLQHSSIRTISTDVVNNEKFLKLPICKYQTHLNIYAILNKKEIIHLLFLTTASTH